MKLILLSILLLINLTVNTYPGIEKATPEKPPYEKNPLTELTLDKIKQGTANNGVINLELVVRLRPGDIVQFRLLTGEDIFCFVKELNILEKEEQIRIYGDTINFKNGGFGFIFSKKGDVAGAIVLREEKITYTVKFSEEGNGFIFLKEPPLLTIQ